MTKRVIKKPRKEFMQVVMIDMEKWPESEITRDTVDQLFESLKAKALRSLAMERLKKHGDGVCIRAWIVPIAKVPPSFRGV